MKTTVWVSFQLEGFHAWKNAPNEHGYLASPHRHVFHFKTWVSVTHTDRDVEFIHLKRTLQLAMAAHVGTREAPVRASCEELALAVRHECAAHNWNAVRVSVAEDGENGAEVDFE